MADRFWSHVERSDGDQCWEWLGCRAHGYGKFWADVDGHRRLLGAHRVAWFLAHGEWPYTCVLHRCDNPGCVRPDHLWLGSMAENNRDRELKGRTVTGDHAGQRNGRAKLTEDAVRAIRTRRAAGERRDHLAAEYGVTERVIYLVVHRRLWTHVA